MRAEPQVYLDTDYRPIDRAQSGAGAGLVRKTKASFVRLTAACECLWSFYEAMRKSRPLPQADQKLTQLGSAIRGINKPD